MRSIFGAVLRVAGAQTIQLGAPHDSLVRVIECAMDRLELAMEGPL